MPRPTRGLSLFWLLVAACNGDPSALREWRPEDHGQPKAPPEERQAAPAASETVTPEQAEARAQAALFNVRCASCHARDGAGGGPGLPPGARAPDLRDPAFQSGRTDSQLAEVIGNGRGMMPAFGPELGAASVTALVRHVRRLGEQPQAEPQAETRAKPQAEPNAGSQPAP